MNSVSKNGIILVLFVLSGLITAQNVNINCNFNFITEGRYTCYLSRIVISDNENQSITIGGNHIAGQSDATVTRVLIEDSNVPFIITQVFTRFPNMDAFLMLRDSGLTRIQSGAFANANNLEMINIHSNHRLATVHENAFNGASRVTILNIYNNSLVTIPENLFRGMSRLSYLSLERNQISRLHVNVFKQLQSLNNLLLSTNLFESIDGNLFEDNPNLTSLILNFNGINSVNRDFLNSLPNLRVLQMLQNRCVNNIWTVGVNQVTIETIRQGLSTCFDNHVDVPGNNVKRFNLKLRGTLIIRDENGNEIIRI